MSTSLTTKHYTYPVRDEWKAAISPYANIAAELDAALTLLQRVEYDEGARMCGESLSRQAQAIAIIWELRRDIVR